MSLEALTLNILAFGLLVSHLASLRLLMDCKATLNGESRNFSTFQAVVSDSVDELVRIGSDVADQIDRVAQGGSSVTSPVVAPPFDLQSTIISLIADKVMGGTDGRPKEQIRTIHSEDEETPQSLSTDEPETN
jgi:hypothetical protein